MHSLPSQASIFRHASRAHIAAAPHPLKAAHRPQVVCRGTIYGTNGLSIRFRNKHLDVVVQVVERGVESAALRGDQWPGADRSLLLAADIGANVGAFAGVAVLQQAFDDEHGQRGAGGSVTVGQLALLLGAQGIELVVGEREGIMGLIASR
jgi:hypothetical protein